MKKKPQNIPIFNGFAQANTTPVPDVLFDELLADLSGAELKVLLYIIRRTKGFKKDTDAISLSQFEKGIVKIDGTVLDRGCGLSRESICNALDSLEKRGCIKSEKQADEYGRKGTTVYSIRFKGEVVKKSDQVVGKSDYQNDEFGSQKIRPYSRKKRNLVVGKSDIQETVIQQTERMNGTSNSANSNNLHSSIPSLSSLSLENASLQDLYARINQLEQQGEDLEHLSTKISTPVENREPVTTRSTSTATNVRKTDELEPLGIYSAEEKEIHGYWLALGFEADINLTNKTHWGKLSKHVHSLEEMDSLYKYAGQSLEQAKDKTVYPGNLVKAVTGWKQEQDREKRLAEPVKITRSKEDPIARMKAIGAQFIKQGVN